MIPYSILSGTIHWDKQPDTEIRILDLSADSFTFRLSRNYPAPEHIQGFSLCFFSFKTASSQMIFLNSFAVNRSDASNEDDNNIDNPNRFFQIYKVFTEQNDFLSAALQLMQEYMQYIDLKLSGEDAELSSVLTGYPSQKESVFPDSVSSWKKSLFDHVKNKYLSLPHMEEKWKLLCQDCKSIPELAIELDSALLQDQFLSMNFSEFCEFYWQHEMLEWHPLSNHIIDAVYIGNSYCFERFPTLSRLTALLQKASDQKITPVIVFPPVKSAEVPKFLKILEYLTNHLLSLCEDDTENATLRPSLEVIVNDWGTAEKLTETRLGLFSMTAGVLLNKRKKDVRLSYKNGYDTQISLLKQNSFNAFFYQEHLKRHYGIVRVSYEACGYPFQIASDTSVIHLPFYQMNTSGNCTLRAACKNGDRGNQTSDLHCPHYCENHSFLYPTMLSMIGWQNSLFGFDDRILWDADYFQSLCSSDCRIVLSSLD